MSEVVDLTARIRKNERVVVVDATDESDHFIRARLTAKDAIEAGISLIVAGKKLEMEQV